MDAMVFFALLACGIQTGLPRGEVRPVEDDPGSVTIGPDCTTSVVAVWPEASGEAFPVDAVEATLAEPDDHATLWLEGPEGRVEGHVERDGRTVRFVPAGPLATGSAYVAHAATRCAWDGWSFRTSELGQVSVDGLAGRVLEIDTSADVPPSSYPGLYALSQLVPGLAMRVSSAGDGSGDVAVEVRPAETGMCAPWAAVPSTFANPWFTASTGPLAFDVADGKLTIEALSLSGALTDDGAAGLHLDARVDVRRSADEDASNACASLGAAGIACVPCADGADACVDVDVRNLVAPVAEPSCAEAGL